jgi:enoyl-CoA hydratase/carnithine racemase
MLNCGMRIAECKMRNRPIARFIIRSRRSRRCRRSRRFRDEAVALGLRIARFAPEVVDVCIHAIQRGLNTTIDEGLAIEAEAFAKMVPTAALRQGLDNFIAARS